MKPTLLILPLFLGIAWSNLLAGLGDTESQIVAAYGKAVDTDKPDENGITTNTYEKGEYLILVQLQKGRSVSETFTRNDHKKMSAQEVEKLLQTSAEGGAWANEPGSKTNWQRSDHKAKAWLQTFGDRPTLLITTQE